MKSFLNNGWNYIRELSVIDKALITSNIILYSYLGYYFVYNYNFKLKKR
jgi:hypothetical protein